MVLLYYNGNSQSKSNWHQRKTTNDDVSEKKVKNAVSVAKVKLLEFS